MKASFWPTNLLNIEKKTPLYVIFSKLLISNCKIVRIFTLDSLSH